MVLYAGISLLTLEGVWQKTYDRIEVKYDQTKILSLDYKKTNT